MTDRQCPCRDTDSPARRFVLADADSMPQLAAILRAAWQPEAERDGITPVDVPGFPAFATAESIGEYAREHGTSMYLVFHDGVPVACGGWSPDGESPKKAWLNRIGVHPERQKRGHGLALLGFLEAQMRDAGFTISRLGHLTANEWLHALYTRLGYVTVEVAPSENWRVSITYMEKQLV